MILKTNFKAPMCFVYTIVCTILLCCTYIQADTLKNGNALKLEIAAETKKTVLVNDKNIIHSEQGTIMFWIKPLYNPIDGKNHIFVQQRMPMNRNGLRVLDAYDKSWGGHKLFFEFDQISMPINELDILDKNQWNHLAVAWKTGPQGYIKIFLNGEKLRHSPLNAVFTPPSGQLYINGIVSNQSIKSVMKNIKIFHRSLEDSEIQIEFNENQELRLNVKDWYQKVEHLKPLIKNKKGQIIEARALFDEKPFFIDDIDRVVSRIKKAGFNIYIPCIWYGEYARWNSKIEKIQPDYIKKHQSLGKDPLKILIERAHSQGIEVHPWFVVSKRANKAHPEFYDEGTPKGKYDITTPEFSKFIKGLVTEVVQEYDVDGINLDYVRTGGVCRSKNCSKRYFDQTGRLLSIDSKSSDSYLYWQAAIVNNIISQISESVRSIKPNVIISVDSSPNVPGRLHNQGRNHKIWLKNKWVDLVFYMAYSSRLPVKMIEKDRQSLGESPRSFVLVGNYDRNDLSVYTPRAPEKLALLMGYIRKKWPGFIAVYQYEMLSDEQIGILSEKILNFKSSIDWDLILNR